MKKHLSIVALVLALAMCLALVACGGGSNSGNSSNSGSNGFSGIYTIGGADSTGTMYAAAAAVASTLNDNISGIKVNATTSSGSNQNAADVQSGDIQLGMCSGDAAYAALNGTGKFEGKACPDIRIIAGLYASLSNWIALKSSGYTYLHDAKGGVFGIGPAASTSEASALLGLQAAGITAENSTFQNVTLGDGAENVGNGTMSAATAFAGVPVGAQMNVAVTKQCVWLGFTDAELDTVLAANPSYYKTVIPAGTYEGQTEDVPTFGVKCSVICRADMDKALVKAMAEAIATNAEAMIKANAFFADMKDPAFICQNMPIALHEGAQEYYQSAGML